MPNPANSRDETVLVNFFKHRGLARIMEQVREYQCNHYTTGKDKVTGKDNQLPLATPINLKYATWFLNSFERLPEAKRFHFSKMLEPITADDPP